MQLITYKFNYKKLIPAISVNLEEFPATSIFLTAGFDFSPECSTKSIDYQNSRKST